MKKLNTKDIFLFGEWYNLFWFHACYIEGLTHTIKKYVGKGLSQVVIEKNDNVQQIYFSHSEWVQLGQQYLDDVIKNPKKLKDLLQDTRKVSDHLFLFVDKFRKIKIQTLSKSEKIKLLDQYHRLHHKIWTLGQVPNVLELENSFLSDYLKEFLSKQKIKKSDQIKIFQTLVTPSELSMAQKEEREMLVLASKENPVKELKKHWQKYKWLEFGWIGPSLKLDHFVEVHKILYKEGKAHDKLKAILKQDEKLKLDKKIVIDKLEIPEDILKLFELLEELLFTKTYRMDALYRSYDTIWPFLKIIAQDYYLSLPQIYSLEMDQIIEKIKKDNFDVNEINEISKYSVKYFDGQNSYLLTGEKALKIMNQIKEKLPQFTDRQELEGEVAYPGKVKGKVVIINLASEMHKFSEGDILVSNVTDPSLMPVMKKAKAFVTNTGGLTCHAAIVARELSTPCIVGTKIATKVFKDGDMVEVDATKGIIRKI